MCVTCSMVCLLSGRERVHGCDIYYSLSQGNSWGLFTVKPRQRRAYFQTASCVRRPATSNYCHSNILLVSVRLFNVFSSFSWKDALLISTVYATPSPRHKCTPYMTTQSYLISWHLDVVSLEALWLLLPASFHGLRSVNAFY